MNRIGIFLFSTLLFTFSCWSQAHSVAAAITTPVQVTQLIGYDQYSPAIKKLILRSAELSRKKLTYFYGSANPNNKGMDCSGTIYYLLRSMGVMDVPRSSDEIYHWVKSKGKFHAVTDNHFHSKEFTHLNPGDLLFWKGTYTIADTSKVTHVMLYLGKNKQGQLLMFGASDGRTYQHNKMWGVSLFDFNLPKPGSKARFIGYSCIPHLTCSK